MNFKNWSACTATLKRLFGVHPPPVPARLYGRVNVAFKAPAWRHDYFPSHHATFYNGKGSQGVDREFLRRMSQGA